MNQERHDLWREAMREKAHALHRQLAQVILSVRRSEGDDEYMAALTEPYLESLDDLYLHEMPVAARLDKALLKLQIAGMDAESAVIEAHGIHQGASKAVRRLTERAMGATIPVDRWQEHRHLGVNLSVSDGGIMAVGFHAHHESPFRRQVADSLRRLSDVALELENADDGVSETLSVMANEDPEKTIVEATALRQLLPKNPAWTPSIVSLSTARPLIRPFGLHEKGRLNAWLRKPTQEKRKPSNGSIDGDVAVIDSDNKSVILRNIFKGSKAEVRCVMAFDCSNDKLARMFGKRVTVYGKRLLNSLGELRLVTAAHIKGPDFEFGQPDWFNNH